jgi:hypothetical protein
MRSTLSSGTNCKGPSVLLRRQKMVSLPCSRRFSRFFTMNSPSSFGTFLVIPHSSNFLLYAFSLYGFGSVSGLCLDLLAPTPCGLWTYWASKLNSRFIVSRTSLTSLPSSRYNFPMVCRKLAHSSSVILFFGARLDDSADDMV